MPPPDAASAECRAASTPGDSFCVLADPAAGMGVSRARLWLAARRRAAALLGRVVPPGCCGGDPGADEGAGGAVRFRPESALTAYSPP